MKDCGECTLCCKLVDIEATQSIGGQWCKYCHNGCTIHETKPIECLTTDCFWRAEGWPNDLRPDRCDIIFLSLPNSEIIHAVSDNPLFVITKRIGRVIKKLVSVGRPVIVGNQILTPDGITRDDVINDVKRILNDRSSILN